MSKINFFSIQDSRECDKKSINGKYVSAIELMNRAGAKIADYLELLVNENNFFKKITFIAGKGNNAGDAFVAANFLKERGYDPLIILTVKKDDLKEDALFYFNKLDSEICVKSILQCSGVIEEIKLFGANLVVDGILGTGFKPPLNEFYVELIKYLNKCDVFIVSIDLPSGMHGGSHDSSSEVTVSADVTLTIGSVKKEFFLGTNRRFCGKIVPVDIGLPEEVINIFNSECNVFCENNAKKWLKRRSSNSHKGSFGHVLIVGGSLGYVGALLLSGLGALRSGCGLLTLCSFADVAGILHSQLKEAMTVSIDQFLNQDNIWTEEQLKKYKAIGIGPGLGKNEKSKIMLETLIKHGNQPLILDADALNLLAEDKNLLNGLTREIVLTPHPGEAARLLGCKSADVEQDRLGAARLLGEKYNSNIILKGSNTIVRLENEVFIHLTGTPLMAAGGMGDVLTGVCVSLMGQGYSVLQALNLAVFLHGKSAEILEYKKGPYGVLASEVAGQIPGTIKSLGYLSKY